MDRTQYKRQIHKTLQVVRPDLKRYEKVAKQLKSKIRERRTLLEEKKSVPAIQVLRHRELALKIAALTEDIGELKSEKILLLNQFACTDDHGITEVKQRVASMESSLDNLDQQEEKYTAELDAALTQYAGLQQQAADVDAMELDAALQALRPDTEHEVIQRLRNTYGKRFDSGMLAQGREDIASLLGEVSGQASIQQKLQQLHEHQAGQHHVKEYDQAR